MANSLVIRKGTDLAKRVKALRAAQYVRMSTDHQRYSIENQAAAIAAYAQQRNLTIVRTYADEGRSGLRIKGRAGLQKLIDDVETGHAEFAHVLVYDVSRWGRFQDVDESAYYEFLCKQNGIKIAYCAEQFDNDGSLLSSIVKNIKRVMAAEFSRELSVKVRAGQCRTASLGYRIGGPLNFGLRRELIGEELSSKGPLSKGQRKSLQTDRVRLQPGSDKEAEIVRCIFNLFANKQRSGADVARQLNRQKVANHHGRPWTAGMIFTILRNENYVGNLVHNRTSKQLGQKRTRNPHHKWVRREGIIASIVDPVLFARTQEILDNRYVSLSDEQMLIQLRITLAKKGKLTSKIIDNTPGLPSAASYVTHFDSLRKAFRLIGYTSPHDCGWMDTREHWSTVLSDHEMEICAALGKRSMQHDCPNRVFFSLDRGKTLTLTIARQVKRDSQYLEQWRIYRRRRALSGLLAVARLDGAAKAIKDYVLMPAPKIRGNYLLLSDLSLHRLNAVRVDSLDQLITTIQARCAEAQRAAQSSRI